MGPRLLRSHLQDRVVCFKFGMEVADLLDFLSKDGQWLHQQEAYGLKASCAPSNAPAFSSHLCTSLREKMGGDIIKKEEIPRQPGGWELEARFNLETKGGCHF